MDQEPKDTGQPPHKRRCDRSVSIDSSHSNDQASEQGDYFPAAKLFEYQWPLGSETAEFYLLQEHVKEFLDIRGIQRKYPDLYRRNLELDERKYLMGRGVVTETQSNMGLVAMKMEEVLEVMAEDYPHKYEEYQSVMQEREFQAALRRKAMESKRMAMMAESRKIVGTSQVMSEAMRSAVGFNSKLAEARQVARKEYMDTQTKLCHVPRRPQVVQPPPPLSRYPVALLPGQYCDRVVNYSPEELNKMPLNTVMDVPKPTKPAVVEEPAPNSFLNSLFSLSNNSTSQNMSSRMATLNSVLSAILSKSRNNDSKQATRASVTVDQPSALPRVAGNSEPVSREVSVPSNADGGVAPDGGDVDVGIARDVGKKVATSDAKVVACDAAEGGESKPVVMVTEDEGEPMNNPPTAAVSVDAVGKSSSETEVKKKLTKPYLCNVCFKGSSCNKLGFPEQMLSCFNCKASIHPSCYNLDTKMQSLLRGYPWQCLDCKSCQLCSSTDQDDAMMCCDQCDRGYHYFCVGLDKIPGGEWWCKLCTVCASCGKGSDKQDREKYRCEFFKGKFLQTLCLACSSYFRSGYFCPICLRVYHDDESDSPMVCCDECDRWIHIECDGISEKRYKELSKEDKSVYICSICQGLRSEKMDKYKKKKSTRQ